MLMRPGVNEVEASAYDAEANHNEAEARLQTHMVTHFFQHRHYILHPTS